MLARIALRMATVEALTGKTLVGTNVLDSEIGALDVGAAGNILTEKKRPFIAVYTDGSKTEDSDPRSLYESGTVELLIEFGITDTMTETDPATDVSTIVGIGIPAADETMEFTLDVIGRQIIDALLDIDDPWAEIWRSLAYRVSRTELAVASGSENGRIAARQIKLSIVLVDDPLRGEPVDEDAPFGRFLTRLEAKQVPNPSYQEDDPESPQTLPDPIATAKAALMRAQIAGHNEPWEAAQRRLGLTRAELMALGLGPIAGDEDRSTPEFEVGDIEMAGIGNTSTVER